MGPVPRRQARVHCDARADAFNAEAAADGWARAIQWLHEHIG
jgi:hypothetical protein